MTTKTYLFLTLMVLTPVLWWSCIMSPSKEQAAMRAIDLFEQYITGDFDNKRQYDAEQQAGLTIHPYARHINRRVCHKINNAPQRDGFWLLEESYYQYPEKEIEIKPYLFFFEAVGDTAVRLIVYTIPEEISKFEATNDNENLKFDYFQMNPSPTFQPAVYQKNGDEFQLFAPNDLGNGMTFTLIETITANQLIVMELLEKDGERLTPYETPIIYDRITGEVN